MGAILILACAPAALAASGPAVTVRVEGKGRTLLAPKIVHPHSGWITRFGEQTGDCPADSALGALDLATHHRWKGKVYSSQSGIFVNSIFGEAYGDVAKYYWAFYVGHIAASLGACEIEAHAGEQVLFAVVPVRDLADYPIDLKVSAKHVGFGQSVTVTVEYWNATGRLRPLAGATVRAAGLPAVITNSHGVAKLTMDKAGTVSLQADHAEFEKRKEWYGYIRSAPVRVTVAAASSGSPVS